nr:formin-binding protein 4-like isoform X1 [Pocillopora verrucosa]
MGRRSKEKQLVAQASRRRTVLQIGRVSRREAGEGLATSSLTRAINPNSISGIGLLGSYGDHSDDEDDEENLELADDRNSGTNSREESSQPSPSSTEQHMEIDAKLADFFKEIESIDADTTSTVNDGITNSQAEEAVSSTTEDEHPMMYPAEGYDNSEGADYNKSGADTYPWQACLDEATNCYYYWNMETNEVQWHPPEQFLSAAPEVQTTSDDKVHVPEHEGEKEGAQHRQDDEENSEAKENQETPSEDGSEPDSKEENSKENSDEDPVSFQVVDSWDDQDNDSNEPKEEENSAVLKSDKMVDDNDDDVDDDEEEVPAKKLKLEQAAEDDSDDDFAVQLLEDTYDKGKQDTLVEESMDMSDEEAKIGSEDKEEKPLLPPEVFEHLKAAPTEDKKGEKSQTAANEKKKMYDKAEEDQRSQILELASVLCNKLDFLEVSRQGVSNLKILLIEMETRISDWREGALDSRHLVLKLCEADTQLKQYEESAAPPGWSCHWDRTHKRYYYTNRVTGDSQWEYPSDETESDVKEDTSAVETSSQSSTAAVSSSQTSVPMWNYSAYVPMVQAPVMSVVMPTVPVVSSSVTADSLANPPVPGTDHGFKAVTLTASYPDEAEESPPPPPGTDDLPPLPPVDSCTPPPPPPEPAEVPPPPPGEEMPTTVSTTVTRVASPFISGQPTVATAVAKSRSLPRSIVDYSDLEASSASPPLPIEPVAAAESSGTQFSAPPQGIAAAVVSTPTSLTAKPKVKKKKKSSKVGTSLLSSKARKVSTLVQKWQSIKQQEEPTLDSSEDEEERIDPSRQIEEWKREHLSSGQAAYNPNFEEIKGDWRERLKQRQAKARSGAADQKDT